VSCLSSGESVSDSVVLWIYRSQGASALLCSACKQRLVQEAYSFCEKGQEFGLRSALQGLAMPRFVQQSGKGPTMPPELRDTERRKSKGFEEPTFATDLGGSHPALEDSSFADCIRGSGLGQGVSRIFRLT
jgi:hypothetical protein